MAADLQTSGAGGGGLQRSTGASLADVVETILDKGLVIDAYVQVSLVGIEILTVNARVVVASVDTYLRFAEAVNRLDLSEEKGKGLPDMVGDAREDGAKGKVKGATSGALEAAGDKLRDLAGGDGRQQQSSRSRR